jgi:hypothetical protein
MLLLFMLLLLLLLLKRARVPVTRRFLCTTVAPRNDIYLSVCCRSQRLFDCVVSRARRRELAEQGGGGCASPPRGSELTMTDKGDGEREESDLCPPTEEQRSTPSLEEEPYEGEPYEGEPRSAHGGPVLCAAAPSTPTAPSPPSLDAHLASPSHSTPPNLLPLTSALPPAREAAASAPPHAQHTRTCASTLLHAPRPNLASFLHATPARPCVPRGSCARESPPHRPTLPRAARRRAPPRLCSSPPPLNEEGLLPLSLPASQLPEFAAPQFSLEPIEPAPRPASPSALLAVPAVGPEIW